MSRKGDCSDNSVAESFFSTLKTELVENFRYAAHDQATDSIAEYIESLQPRAQALVPRLQQYHPVRTQESDRRPPGIARPSAKSGEAHPAPELHCSDALLKLLLADDAPEPPVISELREDIVRTQCRTPFSGTAGGALTFVAVTERVARSSSWSLSRGDRATSSKIADSRLAPGLAAMLPRRSRRHARSRVVHRVLRNAVTARARRHDPMRGQ